MMEYATLNNGVRMPLVGYGVFGIPGEDTARCVYDAISVGYRLIDTAQAYDNEEETGEGIARAIADGLVKREDVFLTTKVWVTEFGYERAKASIEESMRKLKVDYLDLVLVHQCLSDYYGAYRAMEDLYDEGRIRAIGISNFSAERMADIATFNRVVPAVNQVETHMFWQQYALHDWMEKYHVQHEAWGPLAQHRLKDVVSSPVVRRIAEAHGKTPAQVALRQLVQRGIVVIPKSTHKERMVENLGIFDFSLTDEEMAGLRTLDENRSMWAEYDDPNIVQYAMSRGPGHGDQGAAARSHREDRKGGNRKDAGRARHRADGVREEPREAGRHRRHRRHPGRCHGRGRARLRDGRAEHRRGCPLRRYDPAAGAGRRRGDEGLRYGPDHLDDRYGDP